LAKENFIYGIRPVIEAIQSGKELDKILLQEGLRGEMIRDLFKMVRDADIPFQNVPIYKLNRVTGKNHQGVIAFMSQVIYQPLDEVLPGVYESGQAPFFLLLDRITDVRNFGALARTAKCAGVHAIIIPSKGSAQINEDAVKTSAGALLRLPVCRSNNLKDTIVFLKNSGIQVVAVTEKGVKDYYQVDFRLPTAFILGSEEDGISEAYLKLADLAVKIPMFGEIASLNVSVAGGVLMFEAVRQRNLQS
jgi:23S rRNA (guanosine2251-2'-O)-methyltransferase